MERGGGQGERGGVEASAAVTAGLCASLTPCQPSHGWKGVVPASRGCWGVVVQGGRCVLNIHARYRGGGSSSSSRGRGREGGRKGDVQPACVCVGCAALGDLRGHQVAAGSRAACVQAGWPVQRPGRLLLLLLLRHQHRRRLRHRQRS